MKAAISIIDNNIIRLIEDERDLDLPKHKLITEYI